MLDIDKFYNFSTWRSGLSIAFYIQHNIYDYISIAFQLEYSQKGYINEQVETNETGIRIQDVSANTRLDYISTPLLLKIRRWCKVT